MDELDDYLPATEETVLLPLSHLWRRTPWPDCDTLMPLHLEQTGWSIGPIREEAQCRSAMATFMVSRSGVAFDRFDCYVFATLAELQDNLELGAAGKVWCWELLRTMRAVFRTCATDVLDAARDWLLFPGEPAQGMNLVPPALRVWPRITFRNPAMGVRNCRLHLSPEGWALAAVLDRKPLGTKGTSPMDWTDPVRLLVDDIDAESAARLNRLSAAAPLLPMSSMQSRVGRL